jgi:hypothetical protein
MKGQAEWPTNQRIGQNLCNQLKSIKESTKLALHGRHIPFFYFSPQ